MPAQSRPKFRLQPRSLAENISWKALPVAAIATHR